MNFFQQLTELQLVGDLKMVITTTSTGMVVSLLLANEKCGDDARNSLPPLLLRGTAAELDAEFFSTVKEPLQLTSGLQVDMESYLKQVEAAKKQSAMAKANAAPTPPVPAIDQKVVAYTKAMAKVKELVEAKKYKDAIGKLPDSKDHPSKKTIIDARKQWLMQMALDGGGMFPQPYPEELTDTPATPLVALEIQSSAEPEDIEEEETEDVNED